MLRKKGNLIESWSYTAFGEQQGSTRSPWTFSSKRFDPFTSHLAFGQRDYDPTIGRWTTPDPLGFEAGPNLYTYVFNQPLTKRDPLGLYALPSLGMWDSMLIEKNAANMNSPRFQGGMRAMGGLVEGGIGAGLFALPTFGISQFAGSLMMAHGFDNFQSGLRQTFAGSYQEPATIPFLESFGLSHETAHLAHEGFGIGSAIGGGMKLAIQAANLNAITRLPSKLQIVQVEKEITSATNSYTYHPRIRARAVQDPIAHSELINELNFWNNDYKEIIPLSVEERREQEELINNLDSRGLKLVEKIKNSIHEPSKIKYYSEGRLQYLNNNQ